MRTHITIGWTLFALTTLAQALIFAMPEAGRPPYGAYLYGTFHGALWIWVLDRGGRR